jgi:hypothetical protein
MLFPLPPPNTFNLSKILFKGKISNSTTNKYRINHMTFKKRTERRYSVKWKTVRI